MTRPSGSTVLGVLAMFNRWTSRMVSPTADVPQIGGGTSLFA